MKASAPRFASQAGGLAWWSATGSRWRGRIEHVQSGQGAAFLGLDGMLDFVRRVGVMGDDESQSARKEE